MDISLRKKNGAYWQNGTIDWFRMGDIRIDGRVLDSAIQKVAEFAIKGGRLFEADSLTSPT